MIEIKEKRKIFLFFRKQDHWLIVKRNLLQKPSTSDFEFLMECSAIIVRIFYNFHYY